MESYNLMRTLIPESLSPSPNSVSLLPISFALNCVMVKGFPSIACIGIDGGSVCDVGIVGGELHAQFLIRRYSAAF